MLTSFLSALALVLVFEGMMPFSSPEIWKKFLVRMLTKDEKVVRISGFLSMLVGIILLTIVHQFAE